MVSPELQTYIDESVKAFENIPGERKEHLHKAAAYVQARAADGRESQLTFICTHNSRRSHLSQIWAQTAAEYYGIPGVRTFSGGTEATAFNPRAVAALERAGFIVEKTSGDINSVYHVRWHVQGPVMEAFSKVYSQEPNPNTGYCAVMTCSRADAACPMVFGAEERISITYEDPQEFDGTDREEAAYDERCRQICTEMFYLFSQVNPDERH